MLPGQAAFEVETRFVYNPTFESLYAIVPSVPAILLILIPAILMAVSIVREKELGSIINFYVTPTRRIEFLAGKQLPYIGIGMINHVLLLVMAVAVFGVPLKGSGWMLTVCALLYVTATTSLGMLVATFTSSQVAAVFITAILTILPTTQFSGMLQPVSTLAGGADPGHDLAHQLLHARQRRRVHQGPGGQRPLDRRPRPGRLHPHLDRRERRGSAPPGDLAMGRAANILWLGLKELRSLASDPVLVAFILYAFTLAIISQARGVKSEVNNASIASSTRTSPSSPRS